MPERSGFGQMATHESFRPISARFAPEHTRALRTSEVMLDVSLIHMGVVLVAPAC